MLLRNLTTRTHDELEAVIRDHRSLAAVLAWAGRNPKRFKQGIVSEVVTQDEFTHDVIIPFEDVFLVYDTT